MTKASPSKMVKKLYVILTQKSFWFMRGSSWYCSSNCSSYIRLRNCCRPSVYCSMLR